MDSNLKIILEEFEKYKGTFVITDSHKIERLVSIGDDSEDYYYITYNGRKFKWNSCVGRIMPLMGFLREKDYKELIRIARLNHYDLLAPSEFKEAFKKWERSLPNDHKFHTEFFMELLDINSENEMDFEGFKNEWETKILPKKHKDERVGQSLMNFLYTIWPEEYQRISSVHYYDRTDIDCFYKDSLVNNTLSHLKDCWINKK